MHYFQQLQFLREGKKFHTQKSELEEIQFISPASVPSDTDNWIWKFFSKEFQTIWKFYPPTFWQFFISNTVGLRFQCYVRKLSIPNVYVEQKFDVFLLSTFVYTASIMEHNSLPRKLPVHCPTLSFAYKAPDGAASIIFVRKKSRIKKWKWSLNDRSYYAHDKTGKNELKQGKQSKLC